MALAQASQHSTFGVDFFKPNDMTSARALVFEMLSIEEGVTNNFGNVVDKIIAQVHVFPTQESLEKREPVSGKYSIETSGITRVVKAAHEKGDLTVGTLQKVQTKKGNSAWSLGDVDAIAMTHVAAWYEAYQAELNDVPDF